MKTKQYLDLYSCIEDRLKTVAVRYNKNVCELQINFIHRYNVLREVNYYQLDKVESKLFVRAYEGVLRQLENEKK